MQNKLYKAGQKPKGGLMKKVVSGTQQGVTSKKQSDHKGKNRTVNHNRSR
jgi:hypothetical protein